MFKYFILNKPFGTLSQFTKEHAEHVVLGDHYPFPKGVYPVGRLDRDSEGLLLLTDDQKVNASYLTPSKKKAKIYLVQVEGNIHDTALHFIRSGIKISINKKPYKCLPAKVNKVPEPTWLWERTPPVRFRKNIPTSWCEISIVEGKNRQVRKMFAKCGFPVLRLIRVSIGKLKLDELGPGEVKSLERSEIYD